MSVPPLAHKAAALTPSDLAARTFVSGRLHVVRIIEHEPWRGWNQRLLGPDRVGVYAGRAATIRTFVEQFDVSQDYAEEWFRQNELEAYLPRPASGLARYLGAEDYPEVPRGTRRVIPRPLLPDIHELTGQQAVNHLVLAIAHSHLSDQRVLSIPRYFKGTGRGQGTHLNFERDAGGLSSFLTGGGSYRALGNAYATLGRRRLPVSQLQVVTNYAGMDDIRLTPNVEAREVGTFEDRRLVYNVTFSRAQRTRERLDWEGPGERVPVRNSVPLVRVQFTTLDDADAFADFSASGPSWL